MSLPFLNDCTLDWFGDNTVNQDAEKLKQNHRLKINYNEMLPYCLSVIPMDLQFEYNKANNYSLQQ